MCDLPMESSVSMSSMGFMKPMDSKRRALDPINVWWKKKSKNILRFLGVLFIICQSTKILNPSNEYLNGAPEDEDKIKRINHLIYLWLHAMYKKT